MSESVMSSVESGNIVATARGLVVDDDADVCSLFELGLRNQGFDVKSAHCRKEALAFLGSATFDFVLLDLFLGEDDGLSLMDQILKQSPQTKVWVITAQSSISSAVEAMRRGATGFFAKSEAVEQIIQAVKDALLSESASDEEVDYEHFRLQGLVGRSAPMMELYRDIQRMKNVDSTILIEGESGTGKEVVARTLHRFSPRAAAPFSAINCGAIPENLLESELFGHKRGAFTDAKTDRKGIFETCSGGTLLLDEIAEMPLGLQVKILRVLQEREVRPVGSTQSIKVDTRVMAATNKNLEEEVRQGRFREDLFYRLSVLRVDCPPLRERKADIPELAEFFVNRFAERFGKMINGIRPDFMLRLLAYDWPGNVRELQNAIERAVVLSMKGELQIENVFRRSAKKSRDESRVDANIINGSISLAQARQEFECNYIINLLTLTKGNISETARLAKEHRPRLYRLFRKYKIDPLKFKERASRSDQT